MRWGWSSPESAAPAVSISHLQLTVPRPMQWWGPNLCWQEGKPEERGAAGSGRNLLSPIVAWSIASRRSVVGAAAGTTAPRSPITQRYSNKVARAGKMLWDSRELSFIPLDYNPVITPLGFLLYPSTPALGIKTARDIRRWGCWLAGCGLTQPKDWEREKAEWNKLTPSGPHLP